MKKTPEKFEKDQNQAYFIHLEKSDKKCDDNLQAKFMSETPAMFKKKYLI